MELKDAIIFPIYLLIFFSAFHVWQKRTGNTQSKWKWAFGFKIVAFVFIASLYQFYYGGGDTFNYFHHSRMIFNAILDEPVLGIRFLFIHEYIPELSSHINNMWWYESESIMLLARISAFVGFFTFHSYLGNCFFFSLFAFSGGYAVYKVFVDRFPHLEKYIFVFIFFIPSVSIWGSGVFKDTLTYGSLFWMIHAFYFGLLKRENLIRNIIIIALSTYFLSQMKIYILLSVMPALVIWWILVSFRNMNSRVLKLLLSPMLISIAVVSSFVLIQFIASQNSRFALENISKTAKITAMDIYQGWGAGSGSAYYLGAQDGSIGSFLSLAPQAIIVTLFRPWIWEINNPLMLLQAVESLFFLGFTILVIFRVGLFKTLKLSVSSPEISFCLVFALILGLGVGIASYNFGTLSRYKIPLLSFYLMWLLLIFNEFSLKKKEKENAGLSTSGKN